jgi:hypothetical protein
MRKSTFVALLVAGSLLIPAAVFASHQFTDVPNSNQFHTAIGWMKDNNITIGCNPPANTLYCPDDNVTREQMAAFMLRLSENVVPTAYADGDAANGGTSLVASGRVEVNSIAIDVPMDGVLVASGHVFVNNGSGATRQYALNLLVDGANALPQDWAAVTSFENANEQERGNFGYTVSIPVTAGAHTVTQVVGPYAGTASFFYNQEALTLVYYPSSNGSLSLSSVDSSDGDPQGS